MFDLHAVVVFPDYVVGVVLPGPHFVAVAHKRASESRPAALAVVARIVVVNLFWASSSILGIGLIFASRVLPWPHGINTASAT
jgi:threonine efflux protein